MKKTYVQIRNSYRLSENFKINETLLKGKVFWPLKCSVQMDNLGKDCYKQGKGVFTYKNTVKVPALGMVDDIIAMSTCGPESIKTNAIINSFVESKQMQFGHKKCHKLHIGQERRHCPTLKVHNEEMQNLQNLFYIICRDSSYELPCEIWSL